jgi:glycerophosphoryl diester phosphodiesterase
MLILGHRGVICENYSQNSLRAFNEAIATADGFETDACASKDGEVFLIHEALYADPAKGVEYVLRDHLDPASAERLGSRRLDQLTGEETRSLRLKDGQPIPTLREAIALTGAQTGKLLDIELKARNVVEPVLKLVKESLAKHIIGPEAVMFSSFNHYALQTVRQETPDIKIGALFVASDQPTTKLFPWAPEDPGAYTALTAESLKEPLLRRLCPDYFVIPESILTEETDAIIGAEYPAARLIAWVFTEKGGFDLPHLLARLKRLDAQGKIAAMIVDQPQPFLAAVKGMGNIS